MGKGRVHVIETNLDFLPTHEGLRKRTDKIIVHHVGETNRDVSAAEIHKWHLQRGFTGIGYHYVIRKDGSIERGRPRDWVGSHCNAGDDNYDSVGICVVGEFTKFQPELKQVDALTNLIADLCEIYSLRPGPDTIFGHRDRKHTTCPGTNLYIKLPSIEKKVAYLITIKGKVA